VTVGRPAAEVPPSKDERKLPVALKKIIEMNASFGLKRLPVGFWNYLTLGQHGKHVNAAEVRDWANAGFTVTKGPDFDPKNPQQLKRMKQLLSWAQKHEIKLIVRDPRTGGKELPKALADFRDHPAVFGFHVCDEPFRVSYKGAFQHSRRLKKAAPELHPFINLGPHEPGNEDFLGFPTYADYVTATAEQGQVDFLCYDCYFQMRPGTSGWDLYFANLRLMREGSWRHGIPFWTTLLSVGHFDYRCPNVDDLRWQFHTAICSGSTGVLWFFYYMRNPHSNYRFSPVDENWEKTQTYNDLRWIQNAFHKRYGDLFLRLVPTRVTFYPEPFGGGEVFSPNDLLVKVETEHRGSRLLIGEFADLQGRRYVMVVNNSTTDNAHVILTFRDRKTQVHSWDWEGREEEGPAHPVRGHERRKTGYVVGYWLAPGQELVQRVESDELRKTKIKLD